MLQTWCATNELTNNFDMFDENTTAIYFHFIFIILKYHLNLRYM